MTGKRTEQALQAQTDLLATVFESSPNILMLVNAEGRVEKINRTGSEFSGNPQEELMGLLGGEVFRCINSFDGKGCGRNPECADCPIRTRMMRSLREGKTILNEEGRLTVRKDAQELPLDFLISTVPVRIADETKVLITIVDITERKHNEERMRYQAYLLENVSDAIISTNGNFVIESWNRAAEELYGWEENEVLGKTVDEVLKSEFQEPFKKILDQFFEKQNWRGEVIQCRKDGSLISVLSSVRLIQDGKGELVRTIATNRDITDRKRAEEALQLSELQNRTILRTALDGFWLIDPEEGRILDVNDAYCQMSGYTREEILQMKIADFEAIESPEEVLEHAHKIFSEGSDRFESLHRRKDGSIFEVEVSVQSIKVNGGRNFAFIHDISIRKEAEDALRKSEEQYRLLFDEMLSGFALHEIICDEQGRPIDYRFLAVNSAFEQLTGLKADNLIGKTVLEVMPDTEYFWIERYGRVALEGNTDQFDGLSSSLGKYYEARAFCPEPGKFAVMFHDVTERRKAEERLSNFIERLDLATNAARMGVWDWNIQKNELIWDDRMYELYGVNREDFTGAYDAWLAGIHPEDRDTSDEASSRARLGEIEYDTQFRVVWPDNSIHVIKAYGQVVRDNEGNPIRMIGVNYDITDRMQAEQRLKRLLQEKEILLAEVHHRVKNNLQIITSLLGLQSRDIKDERFRRAFEESRNRIQSMALVHEQLYRAREYAQIEFSSYVDQLTSTLFSMYQVGHERIRLQVEAENIYLALEKAIPCGLLLNELITNTLKYAFPKDKQGNLWIKLVHEMDKMILTVGDDGVGIPDCFDLENSKSLGLQLVHLLAVHDLQGSITLDRKNGTYFRIEFPVRIRSEE